MKIIIREASIKDADAIIDLIHQLSIYEKKSPEDVKISLEKLQKHGFGSHPYFRIIVAEHGQKIVGYAFYFFTYYASLGAPILYLEDLFVLEEYRQLKIGSKLISILAEIALEKGCEHIEWHVFRWNISAQNFYQSLNAKARDDLMLMRLERKALENLISADEKVENKNNVEFVIE